MVANGSEAKDVLLTEQRKLPGYFRKTWLTGRLAPFRLHDN